MSDNKRTRARVQSSWARPLRTDRAAKLPPTSAGQTPCCCSSSSTSSASLLPANESKFVFVDSKEASKKRPSKKTILIEKEGSFILSNTPDDKVCSVQFYPNFIDDEQERRQFFDVLLKEVPWQERFCVMFGQRMKMPRLMAWYGPVPYRFSGTTLPANGQWPSFVQILHDRIGSSLGYEFNSVLLNLYENGKSSVAWHSDDELLFGVHPVIASLSFGETRIFEMREKARPDSDADAGADKNVQHAKIPLTDGSLLIMEGETQKYWQHRIPKEFHDRKTRINLTFRTVFSKN